MGDIATSTSTRTSTDATQAIYLNAVADWKVRQAVEQIVASANPLLVIAFGSWARGEHRPQSDLDLAVLVDDRSQRLPRGELRSRVHVPVSIDLLEMTPEELSSLSLRLNSVQRDIVQDGVVVYRREDASPSLESPLASREELLQVKFDEVNLMLKKANPTRMH